ncbi:MULTISPECIES: hypothetical protein [Burkholderia]|uniref:hypothetical protein n=1 Tax=Burkholderia TaxID=32008 RepID=UPI000754ECEE|nr:MULTISPECIES: hypothetical protein [Burkholderia]AOJ73357.1 hypothetical protein WS78_31225 [Burkholderia savannae]KVG41193.1 hypothetical protein WS77_17385 [Burkholderia sp. MSMB0265]KVG81096.1 hypothetical protein WS81_12040 [Burkholderia sp. MSMB2040]KVG95484.1 hypothetical protein WS82_05470 [Burkholderia sp. MSMB2041]KVG96836.1 hypothetical protein WS83_01980 [Burkholderia sp. MSMB2042]
MDTTKYVLFDSERAAIRGLAGGDKSQLEAATAAFDRAAPTHGVNSCVELQFMSEVLAPVPDLSLRATYRTAVLAQPQ